MLGVLKRGQSTSKRTVGLIITGYCHTLAYHFSIEFSCLVCPEFSSLSALVIVRPAADLITYTPAVHLNLCWGTSSQLIRGRVAGATVPAGNPKRPLRGPHLTSHAENAPSKGDSHISIASIESVRVLLTICV